jgi:hypothetical protein
MTARIYQRVKSTMQSGKARTGQWILEHEPAEPRRADPLMGWSGSGDTNAQIRLGFPTLEAAVDYCRRQGLDYVVVPATEKKVRVQAYADNFAGVPIL